MTEIAQALRPDQLDRFAAAAGVMPQLIDCRSPGEFAAGHLPGSMNIPVEELASRRHDIDPKRPVVFICASGRRARAAAELLAEGASVAVLDGGLKAWKESGREVITNRATGWSIERQVRLVAGSVAALGGLAAFADVRWAVLPALIGLGLTFSALTDTCTLGEVLLRMPWNRRRQ